MRRAEWLLLIVAGACGGDDGDAPTSAPDEMLAGRWWIVSDEQPDLGLAVDLAPEGGSTWTRFDWSRSAGADDLAAASRPAPVRVEPRGDGLLLRGPVPHLDADGAPNGFAGDLVAAFDAAPGDGRLVHAEDAYGDGAAAVLARALPAYERDP